MHLMTQGLHRCAPRKPAQTALTHRGTDGVRRHRFDALGNCRPALRLPREDAQLVARAQGGFRYLPLATATRS